MIDLTLVTIHGFWSSPATWERLNAVWYADKRLRGLRIYPFSYPSPKSHRCHFPRRASQTTTTLPRPSLPGTRSNS